MSTLQAIQRQMLHAVLAPQATAPAPVQGDRIADARSRLAVYQHGYRARLRDALKNEFAGLRCLAAHRFERLLDSYIDAHPSTHYNIRWYGAGVAGHLQATCPERPQWADMARLDWAISTAFDAADEPSIGMAELAAIPPADWAHLCLVPQANLQVLGVAHNLEAFRRAADRDAPRPHLRRYARPRRILIWRHAMSVHYRRLDEDEWTVLAAARRGEPFAKLCAALAERHGHVAAMHRMVSVLQTWAAAGLLCSLSGPTKPGV